MERIEQERELYYYLNVYIAESTRAEEIITQDILNRKIQIHFEPFNSFTQSIFFIKDKAHIIFGRKTLSDKLLKDIANQQIDNSQKPLVDALTDRPYAEITPNMLIGFLATEQITSQGLLIFYYPLTHGEKLTVFNAIKQNTMLDITHPFPRLNNTNMSEIIAPVHFWNDCSKQVENLDSDEICLRNYSMTFLSNFTLQGKTVYDPACSSGTFLATIGKTFPEVVTIGQDINNNMIDRAKNHINYTYVGDAELDPIGQASVDFIFIRFLNHGVVTTEYAYRVFLRIAARCKINGYIIITGHTPTLINIHWLRALGFQIKQTIGVCKNHNSVFQFIVVQKTKEISTNQSPL